MLRGQRLLIPLPLYTVGKKMPTRTERESLKPGMTIDVERISTMFSPKYGQFLILVDNTGKEWYTFSGPIQTAFLGNSKQPAKIDVPATVRITSNVSKAGRQFLNVETV
jgi:hypothetical protein